MKTEADQGLSHRFVMGPGSELSVSNVSGRIGVHASGGTEIVVRSSKRGSSRSQDNTQVDVRREGNRVSVQTRAGHMGLVNFGRASSVDYDVQVPRDCSLRIHGVSSKVEIHGSRAEVGVQTVSGDVEVHNVSGDLTLTTVSGDIQGRQLSGILLARTTSGDGNIRGSRFRRFSLNSVSGDFSLETPLALDEHCHAKTVSGDLELIVPSDTRATVQLKTVSGSVSCDLPAEIIKSGRRNWQGRINGGGGQVEMHSVSGDLRIRRGNGSTASNDFDSSPVKTDREEVRERLEAESDLRDGATTTAPEPITAIDGGTTEQERAQSTSRTTADVLKDLEEGILTVEQAMAELDEIDG